MKQNGSGWITRLALLVMLAVPPGVSADEQWHYQATVRVDKPGLVETVLPPGLFFGVEHEQRTSHLDLALLGPDGNPRPFELYWKDESGPSSLPLKPKRALLDKSNTLVWESEAPKDLLIETIRINVDARETLGKVTIEGADSRGWHVLAANSALSGAEGNAGTEIEIEPARYEKLRLKFKGYDKRFRETAIPVTSVTLSGKSVARDYEQRELPLSFTEKVEEDIRVLSAVLPGFGLWIEKITLATEAPFQGRWELGMETVQGGKLRFQSLQSGEIKAIGRPGAILELPVQRHWGARSLVLRLHTGGIYVGSSRSMGITVNLPRMIFYADKVGPYTAQTGLGSNVLIKSAPGSREHKNDMTLVFADVAENSAWIPERLYEKYAVGGGPFDPTGFRWRSRLNIAEAGYYRLVLDRETSLGGNPEKLRIVRDGMQIPFFIGQGEEMTIDIVPRTEYDKARNRTVWSVELPKRSTGLTELRFRGFGVFNRQVVFETPRQGRAGWQPWRTIHWQNTGQNEMVLRTGLGDLPHEVRELRIVMDHGDNSPIELHGLQLLYAAPALQFLAPNPGAYLLFGGGDSVSAARYDLLMLQAHLIDALPKPAVMGDIEPVHFTGFKRIAVDLFGDRSWGLYLVLGLVTLVLIVLIAILFPKTKDAD